MANSIQDMLTTPARFMGPRMTLIVVVGILSAFGLLMVYSASSISALSEFNDAGYYLKRQIVFMLVGLVLAVFLARLDYHIFSPFLLGIGWMLIVFGLGATIVMGRTSHGATRWLDIAGFSLQPSEFAKPLIILVTAYLAYRFAEEIDLDFTSALIFFILGVVVPLVLIFLQPDKGTTIITGAALLVMLYLAGVPLQFIGLILLIGFLGVLFASLKDEYSLQRILTVFNPWSDPYDSGYQIIQGFYAFGNGGLFGVGIGLSRQKYFYLPEAHNDFIFAIIGEETGLIGTAFVCVLFALFVWTGFQIARHANDLWGRLIAAGSTSIIAIQFLVNVLGVIGVLPLTGKPLPFLSYGGSSVISCFILLGLLLSVSSYTTLPTTIHDVRRSQMNTAEPSSVRKDAFVLMEGGGSQTRPLRVNLGPSASERLRGSQTSSSSGSSRRRRK